MRGLFIISSVFLLLPIMVLAATITGRIVDKQYSEPIPAANVFIENSDVMGTSTDLDGRFQLQSIPIGNWNVVVTVLGYEDATRMVIITQHGQEIEFEFELESRAFMGDIVTVTATRSERILKDVPIRTEVITAKDLERKGAVHLYDALQSEPGIRVEQQCSNCNFSLLRVSGLEGGYAQILIDGQSTFSGLASVYGLQQIQTGSIERIEIVKGAGSALYGSDAMGGVVNIILRKPLPVPKMNFGMSIGKHNTNSFHFGGTMRRGKISASYSAQKDMGNAIDQTGAETAPYHDSGADGFTDRTETDNLGAALKVQVHEPMGKDSRINASGRFLNEFRQGGNLNTWEDPFDIDSEHIRTRRYEAGLGANKNFAFGNRVELNLNYANHYRNATNGAAWDKAIDAGMLDGELNLTEPGQQYIDSLGMAAFEAEWHPKPFIVAENIYLADLAYMHPIGQQEFMVGTQYRRSELEQNINNDESDKQADDLGVFAQLDLFTFCRTLEFVLGTRYDMHWSEDELTGDKYDTKAFNPRVAVRYSANEKLTFRGAVGTGFRVPYLFSEDLHLCASAPRIYKDADLEAERALSTSVGADYNVRFHQFGANLFRIQIDNKIEFISAEADEIPEGYDYKWSNVGKASTQGIELFAKGFILDGILEYGLSGTYTMAKFDKPRFTQDNYPGDDDGWQDSDYIPRTPAFTANGKLAFTPGRWSFALDADFTGSMFIDHVHDEDIEQMCIEKTDPYVILGGRIARKVTGNATVFLKVNNMLDYTQPKRDITDAAYIWAPLSGRIFFVGLNVEINP